VSNQDIEGNLPAGAAPGAPAGTPAYFEQQLAKEREAKVLMRDRLRHTEALAAESHALRARMAQELERVTADRDRLRTAATSARPVGSAGAAAASTPAARSAGAAAAAPPPAAPPMTPRSVDWSLRPPEPPRRSGPWRALAMLGGLAAAVGALAWFTGSLPGDRLLVAANPTHGAVAPVVASAPTIAPAPLAARTGAPSGVASTSPAPAFPPPGNAVALPPLTPEQQLAAVPTAAGPAPADAPVGVVARLRKALDDEGIASPVEIDASSGHVRVADPRSDLALRDRTDMLIRAVYAGASLPEPQIEHRWLSPKRTAQPAPAPAVTSSMTPAQAYAARHATQDRGADHHAKKTAAATVAEAEQLRPVLPEGRVTASCRTSLAGKVPHRADMTACMKSSCCSAGNGQAEDCRAYQKAYPFGCSAG
jgi:hypothetical protein